MTDFHEDDYKMDLLDCQADMLEWEELELEELEVEELELEEEEMYQYMLDCLDEDDFLERDFDDRYEIGYWE